MEPIVIIILIVAAVAIVALGLIALEPDPGMFPRVPTERAQHEAAFDAHVDEALQLANPPGYRPQHPSGALNPLLKVCPTAPDYVPTDWAQGGAA